MVVSTMPILTFIAFLPPLVAVLARIMRFTLVLMFPVVVSSALRGKLNILVQNDVPSPSRFQIPCPGPYYSADTTEILDCQGDPNKFVLESTQGYYCCFLGIPPTRPTQQQEHVMPDSSKSTSSIQMPDWKQVKNAIQGQGVGDRLGYGLDNGNGIVLSGNGKVIAVASRFRDVKYRDSGSVRILKETAFGWEQIGQEIHGSVGGEYFGWSVDINFDGTIVAIGGIRYAGQRGKNYQGVVKVYKLVDGFPMGMWTELGEDLEGNNLFDYFGYSVSLSHNGTTLAVGAIQHVGTEGKPYHGYVHVYTLEVDDHWILLGKTIEVEQDGSRFGNAVSLSDNGCVLAIGASHYSGSHDVQGMVAIYKYSDGWEQVGDSIEGETASQSGTAISLAGDGMTVAIGSPSHNSQRGYTRVYRYRDGNWIKIGQDVTGIAVDDGAGVSVALSKDGATLVVGTHQPLSVGHAKVLRFDYDENAWMVVGDTLAGRGISEHYGSSVTVSNDGTRVAISAPYTTVGDHEEAGVVTVYDLK